MQNEDIELLLMSSISSKAQDVMVDIPLDDNVEDWQALASFIQNEQNHDEKVRRFIINLSPENLKTIIPDASTLTNIFHKIPSKRLAIFIEALDHYFDTLVPHIGILYIVLNGVKKEGDLIQALSREQCLRLIPDHLQLAYILYLRPDNQWPGIVCAWQEKTGLCFIPEDTHKNLLHMMQLTSIQNSQRLLTFLGLSIETNQLKDILKKNESGLQIFSDILSRKKGNDITVRRHAGASITQK